MTPEEQKELNALARRFRRGSKVVSRCDGIVYMICPVCGKQFSRVAKDQWAYRIRNCTFDRYGCMRTAERVIEDSMKRKKKENYYE